MAACNERVIVSPVNNEERCPIANLFRTQKLPFGNAISTDGEDTSTTQGNPSNSICISLSAQAETLSLYCESGDPGGLGPVLYLDLNEQGNALEAENLKSLYKKPLSC